MKEGKIEKLKKTIQYKIIKRSKKNYILRIRDENSIELSIPKRETYKNGEYFIIKNIEIIEKKLTEYEKKRRQINPNGTVRFLGEILPKRKNSFMESNMKEEGIKILLEEVKKWSEIIGVYPAKIRVKPLKSSWGICYSNGNITLNIKLIKADLKIMKYVIIHELCHLLHHNHSKEFWNEVKKFFPEYKEAKKILKDEVRYY
ncbi:YgjP-like metallopeptidase domain-containing protein [uncultured Ilyobacter sp.]|uniref:M48 family metallopeptidase n=1 Tax=uncultured Ilyobacter sp. TaxID=544433 RepID=UPI0029C6B57C|nr:YgjP-like metallopeptidase domain-containing protein [uncultured Ilyobacter sp.]